MSVLPKNADLKKPICAAVNMFTIVFDASGPGLSPVSPGSNDPWDLPVVCGKAGMRLSPIRRAMAYVNSGKFRVKTETEQQIWNECSRLIANAIIYYNAAVLSRVYEQKKIDGDQAAMDIIQGISLVAWQHANLFGKFEFSLAMSQVNIEELAARYNDPVWWNKILHERKEDALRN